MLNSKKNWQMKSASATDERLKRLSVLLEGER